MGFSLSGCPDLLHHIFHLSWCRGRSFGNSLEGGIFLMTCTLFWRRRSPRRARPFPLEKWEDSNEVTTA
jgi:hypothetical protein